MGRVRILAILALALANHAIAQNPLTQPAADSELPAGAIARLGSSKFSAGVATPCAQFSPDSGQLLTCEPLNGLRIWDVSTGALLRTLPRRDQAPLITAEWVGKDRIVFAAGNQLTLTPADRHRQ